MEHPWEEIILADPKRWQETVRNRCVTDPETGCWVWQGRRCSLHNRGQGRVYIAHSHRFGPWDVRPTRIAWIAFGQRHEAGIVLSCPLALDGLYTCCNPAHLTSAPPGRTYMALPPTTKLDPDKVRAIRRRYPGESQTKLARAFGITRENVHYIVRRKTWRFVDDFP